MTFESDLRRLTGGRHPILTVRRGGCGCRLGAVYRTPTGVLILAGQRRNQVYDDADHATTDLVPFLVPDMDKHAQPEPYGCRHSSGRLLDLAAIAVAARLSTRRNQRYVTPD